MILLARLSVAFFCCLVPITNMEIDTKCLIGDWNMIYTSYNVKRLNKTKRILKPEYTLMCYDCPEVEFKANGIGNYKFANGLQSRFTWVATEKGVINIVNTAKNNGVIENGVYQYICIQNKIILSDSSGTEYTIAKKVE